MSQLAFPGFGQYVPPGVANLASDVTPGALPSIGSAAPSIASEAATLAGAGGAAGGGGFLSGLGLSVPTWLGGSADVGLKAAAGDVLPLSLLGLAAKTGINTIAPGNSTADVLANAAAGAGTGAGLGTLLLGPGLGTAIGAGGGTLVGAGATILSNIFGGDNTAKDQKDNVMAMAKGYGLDPTQYGSQYDLLNQAGVGGNPKQLTLLLYQQMAKDKQTQQQQAETSAYLANQHAADLQFGLALQSQMQNFMSPYVNNMLSSGVAQSKVLNNLADQMPSAYKGVFQAQAASALNNAQQTAGAYAAQAS